MDRRKAVGEIARILGIALEKIAENPDLLNTQCSPADSVKSKEESSHIEYQSLAVAAIRDCHNDRVFPLETITLKSYEQKREEEIGTAVMHIGSYADEYARSFHALALTVGMDIFFRNGAYRPETEEGRKTIAHELTHVAQHKNRPLADNRTKDELEAEAAEGTEETCRPAMREITVQGKQYRLTERQHRAIMQQLKIEVEQELEWRRLTMRSEEYASLMKAYRRRKERGELPWQQ